MLLSLSLLVRHLQQPFELVYLLPTHGARARLALTRFASAASCGRRSQCYRGLPMDKCVLCTSSELTLAHSSPFVGIRGAGLAYGASIAVSLETKALTFVVRSLPTSLSLLSLTFLRAMQVFKSPDAFAAFSAAKSLIDSLLSGKVGFFTHEREVTAADELTLSLDRDQSGYYRRGEKQPRLQSRLRATHP